MLGFGTPVLAHLFSVILHGLATWLFFRLAIQVGAQTWSRVHVRTSLRGASRPRRGGGLHLRPAGPSRHRVRYDGTPPRADPGALLAGRTPFCGRIWPAYAALSAAVLSDEVAIVTPPDSRRRSIAGARSAFRGAAGSHYSGFFAIVLAYLLVRYRRRAGPLRRPGPRRRSSGIDAAALPWAAPMAALQYLKMLGLAASLNALRTLHAADVASWSARLAPVVAILVFTLFVAWRAEDPVARSGAVLTILPLLPALPLQFLVGSYAEARAACSLRSVSACSPDRRTPGPPLDCHSATHHSDPRRRDRRARRLGDARAAPGLARQHRAPQAAAERRQPIPGPTSCWWSITFRAETIRPRSTRWIKAIAIDPRATPRTPPRPRS
mgnify:CR=1 FL=1